MTTSLALSPKYLTSILLSSGCRKPVSLLARLNKSSEAYREVEITLAGHDQPFRLDSTYRGLQIRIAMYLRNIPCLPRLQLCENIVRVPVPNVAFLPLFMQE